MGVHPLVALALALPSCALSRDMRETAQSASDAAKSAQKLAENVSVKLDTLPERLDRLEKQLTVLREDTSRALVTAIDEIRTFRTDASGAVLSMGAASSSIAGDVTRAREYMEKQGNAVLGDLKWKSDDTQARLNMLIDWGRWIGGAVGLSVVAIIVVMIRYKLREKARHMKYRTMEGSR